jgi:hypothetical protein
MIAKADEAEPKYDPTSAYQPREVEGWQVLVNEELLREESERAEEVMKLLGQQLYLVKRHVPAAAVGKLQTVKIWVERAHPKHACMCYHPDAGWLRANDMNPEKAGGVEIANVKNFLSWTIQQPYMVLHEMAHAYHHQFLPEGYRNGEVRDAYERAMQAKSYEKVLRINGRDDRHYAATNPMEYFAEASEAYFGTNDFYPYVRSELQRHDPAMHDLLGKLWRLPERLRHSSPARSPAP